MCTVSVPVNVCKLVCVHRSEIHIQFPHILNCFLLLSIWLCISCCSLWSNPNTLTDCSAFILRIMFMIICSLSWSQLSWLMSLSSHHYLPALLCSSKFSCVDSVCSCMNVIYFMALLYRRLFEHTLKCYGCRRTEFNCIYIL